MKIEELFLDHGRLSNVYFHKCFNFYNLLLQRKEGVGKKKLEWEILEIVKE